MTAVTRSVEAVRDVLVDDVRARVPQPVEVLEIAAVLESMGITDAVALEDHGADTSFELAEQIFEAVRAREEHPQEAGHAPDRARPPTGLEAPPGRLDTTARSLVAIAPLALLVTATQALAEAGWTASSILALSFGVTAAMLLTMGPLVAIGRRTSILLGFGYRPSALRFLMRASLWTLIGCVLAAALAFVVTSVLGLFTPDERSLFSVALAAFAVFWLLTVGLTLVGAPGPVAVILGAGLGLGIGAGIAYGAAAGVSAGYCTTVAGLTAVCAFLSPRRDEKRVRLPAVVGLAEAAPYAAVGSAFALFIAVPHVLGWFGEGERDVLDRLLTFELSLLLALVPLVLATGVSDGILRSFWDHARELRDENSVDGFRRGVRGYIVGGLVRYTVVLAALSLATAVGVELAVHEGHLHGVSRFVFWFGLAGFLLLGVGQYCSMFLLGLSLPLQALTPLLAGLAVLAMLGVPLSLGDFRFAALAFAVAAAAFAGLATVACRGVLREIPRRYSTAF